MKGNTNLICANSLEYDFMGKKFDIVIGNPPYNVTTGNTISGVGGNNQLYRSFVRLMGYMRMMQRLREEYRVKNWAYISVV